MLHYGWINVHFRRNECRRLFTIQMQAKRGPLPPLKGLYFIMCQKTFFGVANYVGDKWDVISAAERILKKDIFR